MIGLFSKQKDVSLKSIACGRLIPIREVPDKMFAKKMLGDGIAFEPEDGQLHAPCDASVLMVAETKHAVGLKLKNGVELLIHIGLDTVELNGEGFTAEVSPGDRVKEGQVLITMDRGLMKEKDICLVTPMIVTNPQNFKMEIMKEGQRIGIGEEVIRLHRN